MAIPARSATKRAEESIARIRASVSGFDLLCSGTLTTRMMKCGKPNCRCASDPDARHGPYYQWTHMVGGKPTQRYVSEQQAQILSRAIDNYRKVKKLLREWEANTERLIDAQIPRRP